MRTGKDLVYAAIDCARNKKKSGLRRASRGISALDPLSPALRPLKFLVEPSSKLSRKHYELFIESVEV